MSRPEFSMTWNLGNIISIAIFLLAVGGLWANTTSAIRVQEQRAVIEQAARQDLEKRIAQEFLAAANERRELEQRTRYVETQAARTDERFTLILNNLTELKAQVSKLAEARVE